MSNEYVVRRVSAGQSSATAQNVVILSDDGETVRVLLDGEELTLNVHALPDGRTALRQTSGGGQRHVLLRALPTTPGLLVVDRHVQRTFDVQDIRQTWLTSAAASGASGGKIAASMPGRVVRVPVKVGDVVEPGGVVVVLEAMKMENDVKSPGGGRVVEVAVQPGADVESGALLVRLEALDV